MVTRTFMGIDGMKDLRTIRERSLSIARKLGYETNVSLPLLDEDVRLRPAHVVVDRTLALHAVVACSYKFDSGKAIKWLDQESLITSVTPAERAFTEKGEGRISTFQSQVEGLWAFSWALRVVPALDFSKACDDSLVRLLPNLKTGESSMRFRQQASLRSLEEIVSACDLAYCLHWAVNQALLDGVPTPGKVPAHVVIERRRALEWVLSEEEWDAVSLDT